MPPRRGTETDDDPVTVGDVLGLEAKIREVAVDVVLDLLFRPVIRTILAIGGSVIAAFSLLFFGSDGKIGVGGRMWGIADLPVALVNVLVVGFDQILNPLITAWWTFNFGLVSLVVSAGPLGPALVIVLFGAELYAIGWILWRIVRIVDVPIINLGPMIRTVTRPFRWLFNRTR